MNILKKILLGFTALITLIMVQGPAASANTLQRGYERKHTDDTYWCDQRAYTPRERIRVNMIKGELYPPLKGRWDDAYYERASTYVEPGQDITQVIFAQFRTDEELSKIPAHLKVQAHGGDVKLEGAVRTEQERQIIDQKLRQLPGVTSLQNDIQIRFEKVDFIG